MNSKIYMKYIIYNDGSVVVFSDNIQVNDIHVKEKTPISGGSCGIAEIPDIETGTITRLVAPWGGLKELGIRSKPEDSKILNKLIFS